MVLVGLGVIFELPVLIFILVALWNRHAEIPAEEFSLRDADHHRSGRDRYAHARRHHDADLHGADDRAVFHRRARFVCRGAAQARSRGRRRGSAINCSRCVGNRSWMGAGCASPSMLTVACGHDAPRSDAAPAIDRQRCSGLSRAGFHRRGRRCTAASQTGGFDGAKAYEFTAKVRRLSGRVRRPPTRFIARRTTFARN